MSVCSSTLITCHPSYIKLVTERRLFAVKEVFPKLDLLGWYVTEPAVLQSHISIHRQVCWSTSRHCLVLFHSSCHNCCSVRCKMHRRPNLIKHFVSDDDVERNPALTPDEPNSECGITRRAGDGPRVRGRHCSRRSTPSLCRGSLHTCLGGGRTHWFVLGELTISE